MKVRFLLTIKLLFIFSVFTVAQSTITINTQKNFEIIYLADIKYASNSLWLQKIRDDWNATGINLRIYKSSFPKFDNDFVWNSKNYNLDYTLKKISEAGLDIYLRVNFTLLDMKDVSKNYTDDDLHIRSNGERFINPYALCPMLNLSSDKSRNNMLYFMQLLMQHLSALPLDVTNRIKLIVPTLSPDDETEYPFNSINFLTGNLDHDLLTGFSNPEIKSFLIFLKNKYGTIKALNSAWGEGADFTEFSSEQIKIRNYNWDGVKSDESDDDYYKYENGRRDFLDFRTGELKRFIDDCSEIVKGYNFRFGVQFGSIYDGLIEFRGFYDPTPLIESADHIITDDILEYYPNFEFSADYSRSLGKYWSWKQNRTEPIRFSTETNWPGYANYSPEVLIKYWSAQLRTFYENGASALFLSHWGTVGSPNNVPEKVMFDSLFPYYRSWQDTLAKYKFKEIKNIKNNKVFHLANEQGSKKTDVLRNSGLETSTFVHNNPFRIENAENLLFLEFPLVRFVKEKFEEEQEITYNHSGDFVTSFMIKNSPEYIKINYNDFFLTGTSKYMDDEVAQALK